jgi:hypothetical protein
LVVRRGELAVTAMPRKCIAEDGFVVISGIFFRNSRQRLARPEFWPPPLAERPTSSNQRFRVAHVLAVVVANLGAIVAAPTPSRM